MSASHQAAEHADGPAISDTRERQPIERVVPPVTGLRIISPWRQRDADVAA
jgi:hypothetical protein